MTFQKGNLLEENKENLFLNFLLSPQAFPSNNALTGNYFFCKIILMQLDYYNYKCAYTNTNVLMTSQFLK